MSSSTQKKEKIMPHRFIVSPAAPSGGGPLPDYGRDGCASVAAFWQEKRPPVFALYNNENTTNHDGTNGAADALAE